MKNLYKLNEQTGELEKNKQYYINKDEELTHRYYEKKNAIEYISPKTGRKELLIYNEEFSLPKVSLVDSEWNYKINLNDYIIEEQNQTRNFYKKNNLIIGKNRNATLENYEKSRFLSAKRAKKNFFNYALNNNWEYFITLTFSDSQIRYDYEAVKEEWINMKKLLKQLNNENEKDIKILGVPEEHEKGGWHFHLLLSGVDLNLKPGRNNKEESKYFKKFIYSKSGAQIFNWTDFKKGYSQVCLLQENKTEHLLFYISKYIAKNRSVPFNCKAYWKTSNLEMREVNCLNLSDIEKEQKIKQENYEEVKKTDTCTIYRIKTV